MKEKPLSLKRLEALAHLLVEYEIALTVRFYGRFVSTSAINRMLEAVIAYAVYLESISGSGRKITVMIKDWNKRLKEQLRRGAVPTLEWSEEERYKIICYFSQDSLQVFEHYFD